MPVRGAGVAAAALSIVSAILFVLGSKGNRLFVAGSALWLLASALILANFLAG